MTTKTFTGTWAPWPWFDEEMINATTQVLQSGKVNYWTGDIHTLEDGTKVRGENGLFEYEFAQYHKSKHAIAVANGTLALELALQMFNIGTGDEVITTSRTFIASASACVMRGAIPRFADIDVESQNITAETIAPLINKKTRAVTAVHLGGWACDLGEIQDLLDIKSKEYGHKIYLIEDCAQCLGGEYKGQKLGSIGDAGCFSFCQDKIITTGGEGGMLITNDDHAYLKAWAFKDHGKNFNKYNTTLEHPLVDVENAQNGTYYTSLGTNWRLTEMQAAIGRIALRNLDDWNLKNRMAYAKIIDESFSKIDGLQVVNAPEYIKHPYYKYYVLVELDKLKPDWNRDRIMQAINAEGVVCQYGSTWGIGKEDAWETVHLPDKTSLSLKLDADLPNDLHLGQRVLMFQVHPTLTEEHIQATITATAKTMEQAVEVDG